MTWHDLEQIFEIELGDRDYEFDLLALGRAADGGLWWGADAGCSCPCPWEDGRGDFCPIRELGDWRALEEAATTTEARDAVAREKLKWKRANFTPEVEATDGVRMIDLD